MSGGSCSLRKQEVMRRDRYDPHAARDCAGCLLSLDVPPQSVALSVAISMRMRSNE